MTYAQRTMAKELASLVHDNLPCKNLILSVEDMLVNYLEDDTSLDEVLELEPMNSYHRMLVHRLAEIFGFSHHSVGEEEEDRHLVLERSPETSMWIFMFDEAVKGNVPFLPFVLQTPNFKEGPDILVSDLLSQCGEKHYVLRRKEVFPGQKVGAVSGPSLDERETAYSEDVCSCKQLVHELTSLVKKNIPCKNLILSLEDMLINYLHDDKSLDGVLELEPMNSYHRMLVHQLAEIFGFSHYSAGEGEDRHLVLERSPETSIPDFLVSAYLPPMTYDVLRRKVVFPDMGTKHEPISSDSKEFRRTAVEDVKIEYVDERNIQSSNKTEIDFLSGKNPWACAVSKVNESGESEVGDGDGSSKERDSSSAEMKSGAGDEYLKQEEHTGGAKRLFGNAFGMHERDINLSKKTSCPQVWQPENSSDKPASVGVQDLLRLASNGNLPFDQGRAG